MTATFGRRGSFGGWDRFDYALAGSALLLVTLGLVLIHSAASHGYDGPVLSLSNPAVRQGVFAVIAIGVMVAVSRIDYHYLTHYAWLMYGLSVVSLIAILTIGETVYGSTRWFNLGPIQVQPSEFAKLAMIFALARFFSERGGDARELRTLMTSLALILPVALLVFLEPDLGTAIVFGAIWVGVVLVAGANRSHLLILAAVALAVAPFVWTFAVADYQVERISVLIDPYEDQEGLGAGYNNIQAEVAVGSGQAFGKGLMNGDQTQFGYLKVSTKDFIFAVLAEELGYAGVLFLFFLFGLLLFRGIRVADMAGDVAGQLLAVGIVMLLLMQTFINVAVNVGIFPVTGIPLPFLSQGGSSLVTVFASIGVLQSILLRHRAYRQA